MDQGQTLISFLEAVKKQTKAKHDSIVLIINVLLCKSKRQFKDESNMCTSDHTLRL